MAFTSGLPDFSWCNIPKWGKINQITIKYTKWEQNRPDDHIIPASSISRLSKIYPTSGILGLKIYHLATLLYIWLQNTSKRNFQNISFYLCFLMKIGPKFVRKVH
jgi:hypothetical protein